MTPAWPRQHHLSSSADYQSTSISPAARLAICRQPYHQRLLGAARPWFVSAHRHRDRRRAEHYPVRPGAAARQSASPLIPGGASAVISALEGYLGAAFDQYGRLEQGDDADRAQGGRPFSFKADDGAVRKLTVLADDTGSQSPRGWGMLSASRQPSATAVDGVQQLRIDESGHQLQLLANGGSDALADSAHGIAHLGPAPV